MTRISYRTSTLLAALAIAVALFAAACGGDTETTEAAAPESGKIIVSGLVDSPMTFTFVDMDYMNWETVTAEDPTAGSTEYDGVKLSEVFDFFGVQSEAKTVHVTGAAGASADITLADVGSDALMSVADDDSFSLVMPGMAADAWVKDVVSMEFK